MYNVARVDPNHHNRANPKSRKVLFLRTFLGLILCIMPRAKSFGKGNIPNIPIKLIFLFLFCGIIAHYCKVATSHNVNIRTFVTESTDGSLESVSRHALCIGDDVMTSFIVNTCQPDQYLTDFVIQIDGLKYNKKFKGQGQVQGQGQKQTKVLLMGLGGGYLAAQLATDNYDVTVLEINPHVIEKARSDFFHYFEACGLNTSRIKIIEGDAEDPPDFGGVKFDIIVFDIPPIYESKGFESIAHAKKFAESNAVMLLYFWNHVNLVLPKDSGWQLNNNIGFKNDSGKYSLLLFDGV